MRAPPKLRVGVASSYPVDVSAEVGSVAKASVDDKSQLRSAPIGVASLTALVIVALSSLAFRLLLTSHVTAFLGQWPVSFIIIAYLPFSPGVAGALYSVLFERSKAFGVAGLAIGLLTVLVVRESVILLDGLLALPFWFLAVMGVAKFVRWRGRKIPVNTSEQNL